jgi:predicted secreted hydrolase
MTSKVVAAASILLTGLAASKPAQGEVAYPPVVPGHEIALPRDEGSHPQFRIEWWYLTGWLSTEGGATLGFQVTFFRTRPGTDEENPSRFAPRQLLFAHAAVSDPTRGALLTAQKSARAGFGLAQAAEDTLSVHIDQWQLRKEGTSYRAAVHAEDFSLELDCAAVQSPLLHGANGFSQKGPQQLSASYYYSLPQLRTTGFAVIDGRRQRVEGVAWFDHEWSSALLDSAARGWDWVGINLDDGAALMALRIRDEHHQQHWAAATTRQADARTTQAYGPDQVRWEPVRHWRSARTGIRYPVEWQVVVGQRRLVLHPLMDDQENDARGSTGTIYWEGAVRVFDEHGRQIGRGYLELTGYGPRMRL